MSLAAFLVRRTCLAAVCLAGTLTLLFVVMHLSVEDPRSLFLEPGFPAEYAERRVRALGLDDPMWVQYFRWLASAVRLDFGLSFHDQAPVLGRVLDALPFTLLLGGTALLVIFGVGIALALLSVLKPGGALDTTITVASLVAWSMPGFWVAVMLIAVAVRFVPGLPIAGAATFRWEGSPGWLADLVDRARHMVLPVTALCLAHAGGIVRFTRASCLEALGQDYVLTARAKGLGGRAVLLRHALRNALLPVVSLLGLYLPILVSGSVVIERIFSWPGIGSLLMDAIDRRDVPVVLGVSVFTTAGVVVGSLAADLLYGVVDPRVRRG